jgi:hypothetical protein
VTSQAIIKIDKHNVGMFGNVSNIALFNKGLKENLSDLKYETL